MLPEHHGEPKDRGKPRHRRAAATGRRTYLYGTGIGIVFVYLLLMLFFYPAEPPPTGFPEVLGNRLLWSRGWAAGADVPFPDSSYHMIDTVVKATEAELREAFLPAVRSFAPNPDAGAPLVLWVRTIDLALFGAAVLPALEADAATPPLVLVSTDGYYTMPDDLGGGAAVAARIIESRLVVRWYAQNLLRQSLDGCCAPHEQSKVVPVPMGVDFHTNTVSTPMRWFWRVCIKFLGFRRHWSGSLWADRARHMRLLADAKAKAVPPERRKHAIWSDAHLKSYPGRFGDPRAALKEAIARHGHDAASKSIPLHYAEGRVPQAELWEKYGTYRFVVGALGMGMDCHRTWEVFHLGAVLVTLKSPLDELYQFIGAPVIILDDWEQLFDSAHMDAEYERIRNVPLYSPVYDPLPLWPTRTAEDAQQPPFRNLHAPRPYP